MGQGVYLSGEVKETSRSESKKTVSGNSLGLDVKASEITGIGPETGRSNPGQDEVWRKPDGSLLPLLETICSGDLGLGVKSQSRLVMAGSFRNASQCSII